MQNNRHALNRLMHWLPSAILLLVASSESFCEDENTQLLQSSQRKAFDRSLKALEDLAETLLLSKKECLISSMECLPALKQVRHQVWPYIHQLLNSKVPFSAWEPSDFHAQVTKAQMTCNGDSNYTILYHHVWKAAGWSAMRNLESVSTSYIKVTSMEKDFRWCENVDFNSMDKQRLGTFTFVREPLARFVSGYAEFERLTNYSFIHSTEPGSIERAKLFLDRFFEDGAVHNGHVKPQSEYFAPFSSNCRLPIDFVGKVERISEDWKKLMKSKNCAAASIPFNQYLGQHPTDPIFKYSLSDFISLSPLPLSAVQHSTHISHLKSVLQSDDHAYLRALCWLHLSDYVMFDYALPEQCNDPEMLMIMNLTKAPSML